MAEELQRTESLEKVVQTLFGSIQRSQESRRIILDLIIRQFSVLPIDFTLKESLVSLSDIVIGVFSTQMHPAQKMEVPVRQRLFPWPG